MERNIGHESHTKILLLFDSFFFILKAIFVCVFQDWSDKNKFSFLVEDEAGQEGDN